MRAHFVLIALCLTAASLPLACDDAPATAPDRPVVLATTGMIADAVRALAGEAVEVEALMRPGVDPHLFKASEGDVRRLSRADLILYNGLLLEGKLAGVLGKLERRRRVVAVAEAIPAEELIASDISGGHYDPHVWFDVSLWRTVCAKVAAELEGLVPAHASAIRSRLASYDTELEELHQWVKTEIATIPAPSRVIVTAHDAFGYFGRRYQMEVVGIQGLSTATKAGLTDVQRVVTLLVDRQIPAVFIESSVSQQSVNAVREACRARGHDVVLGGTLYSDSLGPEGSGADTYVTMIRNNVRTIVEALR